MGHVWLGFREDHMGRLLSRQGSGESGSCAAGQRGGEGPGVVCRECTKKLIAGAVRCSRAYCRQDRQANEYASKPTRTERADEAARERRVGESEGRSPSEKRD